MLDKVIAAASAQAVRRVWIVSDLQQQYPQRATHCMTRAVDDFLSLRMPCDAVCYLGDAVEGHDPGFLMEMAWMQREQLSRVQAPVYYVLGNHDFDYFAYHERTLSGMRLPFWEFVRPLPQWHTQETLSDLYYTADLGEFALCFLTDHADAAGRWYTTHGEIRGDSTLYPYTPDDYRAVMAQVAGLK